MKHHRSDYVSNKYPPRLKNHQFAAIMKPGILICMFGLFLAQAAAAQRSSFLDHLRVGFGAGINAAQVIDLDPYSIYEDLTGNTYESWYSGIFQNIGDQYFAQIEWTDKLLVVSLKPGTYSYRFSQYTEVAFSSETVQQETSFLLRYLSVPLEFRLQADLQRFRPYGGITASYSTLLRSNDPVNTTLLRSRFSAGIVAGTYVDLRYVILDLNAGYLSGLHNITSKQERFTTGNGTSFAQDDLLLNHLQINLSVLFSLQKQKHFSNVECFY